jgi:hypothetical protein
MKLEDKVTMVEQHNYELCMTNEEAEAIVKLLNSQWITTPRELIGHTLTMAVNGVVMVYATVKIKEENQ